MDGGVKKQCNMLPSSSVSTASSPAGPTAAPRGTTLLRAYYDLVWIYRWFSVVPQGCVVFPVFFGDFRSSFLWFSWRSFEGVFLRDSCWVSRMRTLCLFGWWLCPRTFLNRSRFDGFSSCSSSWPRGPKSAIPFDCGRFGSILLRERLPRR
jgi:hypothetical protein